MGVIFRRIGGRIVPIRVSQENKDRAKGGAAITAGAIGAVQVGKYTSKLMHKAADYENRSRTASKAYFDIAKRIQPVDLKAVPIGSKTRIGLWSDHTTKQMIGLGKKATGFAVKAKSLEKKAFRVRGAGIVATAALFGYGVNKFLDHSKIKHDEKTRTAVTTGTAALATFGVYSSYLKGVGTKGVKNIALAFKRAVKVL